MPDAREAVSVVGVGYSAITYAHDGTILYNAALPGGSAQVGLAVTLSAAKTVSTVAAGEEVEGKLIKVEPGGFCVVQTGGHMTLPAGTGAVLTPGAKIVGALLVAAEGYISAAVAGTAAHHVVSRGTIIDGSVTTAVMVRMEAAT